VLRKRAYHDAIGGFVDGPKVDRPDSQAVPGRFETQYRRITGRLPADYFDDGMRVQGWWNSYQERWSGLKIQD
jgi:hypothetical protein